MSKRTSTHKELRDFIKRVHRIVGDYPYDTLNESDKALRDAIDLLNSIHRQLEEAKSDLKSTSRRNRGSHAECDQLRAQRVLADSEWLHLVHTERALADKIAAERDLFHEQLVAEANAHALTQSRATLALEALEQIRDGNWNNGLSCAKARTYMQYVDYVLHKIKELK